MSTTYKMAIQASRKFGFAALLVGLAGWAVAQNSNETVSVEKRADQLWQFNGTEGDDPTDANLYTLFTGDADDACPDNSGEVCVISAPESGGQPEISNALRSEIMSGTKTAHVFRKNN